MNCRYVSSTQPRVISGRHEDPCVMAEHGMADYCKGCLPCSEPHCRVCSRTHADGTCAECKAATRETLHEIARMCDALPEEVEHRGIDGEAMMLLGPAADPEARGHVEAAYLSGRLPEGWIEAAHGKGCPLLTNDACTGCAGGELHPMFVLGTWDAVWRDALEHDEPRGRLTLDAAATYLDQQLHYMADFPHVPFEDFARDLRRCAAHLESVLHDGEQRDTGAPCMACGTELVHKFPSDELPWSTKERPVRTAEEGWACPRCRRWHTENQYRLSVSHLHRKHATHLTDRDMEIRTGISAATVRSWSRETHGRDALIGKRREEGRTVYAVAEVEAVARQKGMLKQDELTA